MRPLPVPKKIVSRAVSFHGHLGPFLMIGVRMGLIGLKRLSLTKDKKNLSIAASLPLRVPFSCIIDGLQVTTRCTVGNQKLTLTDSSTIHTKFERKDNGQKTIITIKPSAFEKLKSKLLKENMKQDEVQKLAWEIAKIPEEELFIVA